MNSELTVYNSLSGKKENFKPLNPPYVGMYVCGPTVYSDVHLGNCRTFISFDIMYRYLTHLGYKVRYVRNITDVGHLESDAGVGEDKIAKKARLENLEPMEIVQRYANGFHDVMAQFNTLSPSIEPTATGHLIEQIEMIEKIIKEGFAYEVNGSVYFDVPKYNERNDYGKLSGRKIEDLLSNTRDLDGQDEKRNPVDFALWKKADDGHIMKWASPWSVGFPGWHLECSVMSTKYLGETFDIHGGGMDLKFPHHECEIAQATGAYGKDPVNYWLHANMLTMNGQKMSKSLGNSFLPDELFRGDHQLLEKAYSPMTVKFFMLQSHYASTLDFSNDALQGAEKGYKRLMKALKELAKLQASDSSSVEIEPLEESLYKAMNDDFNTPIVIAKLFDGVKIINQVKSGEQTISSGDLEKLKSVLSAFTFNILGLQAEDSDSSAENNLVDGVMDLVLDIREQSRTKKDFETSDFIRDKLGALNVVVKDGKDGASWTHED